MLFIFLFNNIGYKKKYHIIKINEPAIIPILIAGCHSVCRVIKPSRKAAVIIKGINAITIFVLLLAPLIKDIFLECVQGNKMLFPNIIPAPPATTNVKISIVPCIHIVVTDSYKTLYS